MKIEKDKSASPRTWAKPVLTRYQPSNGGIQEYQLPSGGGNSFKCADPDTGCGGGGAEGAAALPPWLLP